MITQTTENNDMVDYTKMRKGTKANGRLIDYCPKCHRKGQKTVYEDGSALYVHAAKIRQLFADVTDKCVVGAGQ